FAPKQKTELFSARTLAGKGSCGGREKRHAVAHRTSALDGRPQPSPDFMQLVLDFLGYLELERGMARNTLQSYRSDLLQFGAFLAARGMDTDSARPRDV